METSSGLYETIKETGCMFHKQPPGDNEDVFFLDP